MPMISTPAIVLQAFAYSESSKILRLLTPSHGVCAVIAKGAQRPRSRFGGLLETFTEGTAQFSYKSGRDLHTLTGFDLIRSRQALGHDLVAFAGASLLAELVLRCATAEAEPALFDRLSAGLGRIVAAADASDRQRTVIAEAWALVALLGYRPQLDACTSCATPPAQGEELRFDVDAGGVACARCRPRGRPVPWRALLELQALLDDRPLPDGFAEAALHRALLRAFVAAHLGRDQAFRSLDLFLEHAR